LTTTTRRNRPVQITDAPEHRSIPIERVELRDSEDDDNEIVLEGYASTFEDYEMYGGPEKYGWIERIDPKAFDVTLREKPDLHLLINHAGMPLARTKSGNLDLVADKTGLKVVARLDKRDPEVQSLAVKMERGDMDEMSFAFRVKAQSWRAADGFEDDDQSDRTITEVSLHKGDVSVVNWGANPNTSVGLRSVSDALKVLADADESEYAEIRADGTDVINMKLAQEKLASFRKDGTVADEETTDEAREESTDEGIAIQVETSPELLESLSKLLEPFIQRLDALELLQAGTAEVTEEERSDEDEVEDTVEDEPVVEEDGSRLAEALAELGELPDSGTFSVAAADAFVD
jgi:HK97 family phage prohead protease